MTTSPLLLYNDATLCCAYFLAEPPNYPAVGERPGVSDDGNFVAFMARHATNGTGIFGDFPGIPQIKVAGVTFDGRLDPGETWNDADNDGIVDPGEDDGPFQPTSQAPFPLNKRVGVNRALAATTNYYTAAYLANGVITTPGQLGPLGLYTSLVDLSNLPSGNVLAPVRVVQVGDTINGLPGTVTDIDIYL